MITILENIVLPNFTMKIFYCCLTFYVSLFMCCLSEVAGEVNRTKHTLIENSTSPISEHGTKKVMTYINNHMDSLKRGMYVFLGVTIIVALYFGIRVYRSRKQKVKSYGLLSSGSEQLELNAINSDSDDDYTVFESKPIY